MERKNEEKQLVDLSKQPIVKLDYQGFVVFYLCISLFYTFLLNLCFMSS